MQKSNILGYFMIITSSFSLSGAQAPQEREFISFTQELKRQHEAEFYNILSARKQEKDINAEMNRIAQQQKKTAKRSFKRKSCEWPKFC